MSDPIRPSLRRRRTPSDKPHPTRYEINVGAPTLPPAQFRAEMRQHELHFDTRAMPARSVIHVALPSRWVKGNVDLGGAKEVEGIGERGITVFKLPVRRRVVMRGLRLKSGEFTRVGIEVTLPKGLGHRDRHEIVAGQSFGGLGLGEVHLEVDAHRPEHTRFFGIKGTGLYYPAGHPSLRGQTLAQLVPLADRGQAQRDGFDPGPDPGDDDFHPLLHITDAMLKRVLRFVNGVPDAETLQRLVVDTPWLGPPNGRGLTQRQAKAIVVTRGQLPDACYKSLRQILAVRGVGKDSVADIVYTAQLLQRKGKNAYIGRDAHGEEIEVRFRDFPPPARDPDPGALPRRTRRALGI